MKFGSPMHAREDGDHVGGKQFVANLALAGGADAVMFEKCGCDTVVIKRVNGVEHLVGVEWEKGSRNVVRNVTRDIEQLNCLMVVVVAGNESTQLAIVARLEKYLPEKYGNRVLVVGAKSLSENVFSKIFNVWLRPAGAVDIITERRCTVSAD